MKIIPVRYDVNKLPYIIRSAEESDAEQLASVRLQIDGETTFLDREPGEGVLTEKEFIHLIRSDSEEPNHLFLIAEREKMGKLLAFLAVRVLTCGVLSIKWNSVLLS